MLGSTGKGMRCVLGLSAIGFILASVILLMGCSLCGVVRGPEACWSDAEAKWQAFAQPYLEKIRQQESNPGLEWVEFRSRWISKCLPDCRIYTIPVRKGGTSALFALTKSGQIFDLGMGDQWSAKGIQDYYSNPPVSDFFRSRRIKVARAKQAIALLKCIKDVTSANNAVAIAQYNRTPMPDPHLYDKDVVKAGRDDANWEFIATRKGPTWLVEEKYVGPPAMIMMPPTWEIIMDEHKRFLDIRQARHTIRNAPGSP